MKTCYVCGKTLDDSMFGKNSKSNDGLQARCRECRRKLERAPSNVEIDAKRAKRRLSKMMAVAKEDVAEVYMPGEGMIIVSLPPMTA